MSDKKSAQMDRIMRYAHLIERQSGRAVRPFRADGYVNLLNRYGTEKDTTERYQFRSEPQVPDELLTMFYESNGLFAKIIDTPAEEAIKHGFKLVDLADQSLEDFYVEALDELDWEETAMTAIKWARLFGGSIAVMLINDGGGLEDPLDWRHIKSIDDIRVYDRSLVEPDYATMFSYDTRDPFRTRGSRLGMPEYYRVFSKFGSFTVHDSRCLVFQNGLLPENTTNSIYQLWGVPEYVRINRAIRDAEVAHGSATKLLDRSIQAVYSMKDLSAELATEDGENKVLRRLQTIDMARGLMNSIVIDSEGEDYNFRTFQFAGVSDVIDCTCNFLSALTSIPQTILFGRSPAGMNSTGESDMENYYNFVERIERRMVKKNLRYLLSVLFQAGVATGEVDEVPKIKIQFNPLWSLSDSEQADLEQKRAQTQQTKAQTAQIYVGMQAVDPSEVRKKLADSEDFDVENMLDEVPEEELFPTEEELVRGGLTSETAEAAGELPQQGNFAQYAQNVSVKEHEGEPGDEGAAPAAAPAATKLPQDMSEEEKMKAQEAAVNPPQGDSGDDDAGEEKSSVGVLVVNDGRVLSGTRHNDFGYGLVCGPGGHVEPGETPDEAAFRETEEEFGIKPKELIFIGRGPREEDTGLSPYIYLCTSYEGEPNCADLEMVNAKFRTLEELDELSASMFQPFADGLDVLMKVLDTAIFYDNEAGDMTEHLNRAITQAMDSKDENNDGGPGSGNFGHEGVPGKVGGSAPSAGSLNKRISDAYAKKDYGNVDSEIRKCLREAPVGSKIRTTSTGGVVTVFTKTGDSEYEYENTFGGIEKATENYVANRSDMFHKENAPKFEEIKAEDIAQAKIESGDLKASETGVQTQAGKTSKVLGESKNGTVSIDKNGTAWQKIEDGSWVNLETGEVADDDSVASVGGSPLKYEGNLDFYYGGGKVAQELMDRKMSEFARHQMEQDGKVSITSEELEEIVGSVRHYGLGGDCQLMLATQDPSHYQELLRFSKLSEEEMASFAREAQNVERYIALSDKVEAPLYRGIGFNTSTYDQETVEQTLSRLKVGETIDMGHIASWSTNEGTARSYAGGVVEAEIEEGENYSIVYSLHQNKSAASLKGINPEGECLSPKSAKYRVKSVSQTYDEDLDVTQFDVELEEVEK